MKLICTASKVSWFTVGREYEADHAKIGAKVAEVLALRYPMFIFHDVSAKGFVEIRINRK